MRNKKKGILSFVLVLLVATMVAGCGKVNIGYVNQSRLNDECPQIKASVEEWQGKLTELQKKAIEDLNNAAANGATQEELAKMQQEIQIKAASINQQYQVQMRTKVDIALEEVAKEKKLDTILKSTNEENVVLSGGVDVTDDVIKKLQ